MTTALEEARRMADNFMEFANSYRSTGLNFETKLREAFLAAIELGKRRERDWCAKVCASVEGPFDEHSQAPENGAFYLAVELCEQAIERGDHRA